MCARVEEIGEEARRATPMYVPSGPSDAARKSITCVQILVRNCVKGIGKRKSSLSREEQSDDGIPGVPMNHAFLHNTGDKDAKVTFLTMVDGQLSSMVATAVQKNGHDNLVERFFLLKGLKSFGVTAEMVLQDGQRKGTDRCGKTRGS